MKAHIQALVTAHMAGHHAARPTFACPECIADRDANNAPEYVVIPKGEYQKLITMAKDLAEHVELLNTLILDLEEKDAESRNTNKDS
jgi:hypothetical protein